MNTHKPPLRFAWTIWGFGALFYLMGFMLGPTLLQPAVGWMLDRNWHGDWLNGAKIYSLNAYRAGFALMTAWALVSLGLIFFCPGDLLPVESKVKNPGPETDFRHLRR
jgi:hypothetical protein